MFLTSPFLRERGREVCELKASFPGKSHFLGSSGGEKLKEMSRTVFSSTARFLYASFSPYFQIRAVSKSAGWVVVSSFCR